MNQEPRLSSGWPNARRLLERTLRCPVCGTRELAWHPNSLNCSACAARLPIVDGVLVCLPEGVAGLDPHKARQAQFFDAVDREWEIERPRGAPSLYRWLLEHKQERSVRGLNATWRDRTALTICGGSGMDAAFLAELGADVINTDISLAACRRSVERARRRGVELVSIVADAEALPFPDQSIDLVYVHDGLHHLEDPLLGLSEMIRVARVALSINEPARALATRLAVRINLAEEREDAGNAVARLDLDEITRIVEEAGFTVSRRERYAMLYRHHPGRISSLLSKQPLLPVARGSLRLFNAVLGRIGNKLTVQAVRNPAAAPSEAVRTR